MPITDLLERNSKLYGDEIALVEINPEVQEEQRVTWKEYALIQPTSTAPYRREITWSVFDEKANRVANMLLSRGIRKGQKVAILLMNCLEWLPIYFGILKAGAIAVPLNFRYTSDEIDYCLKLADVDVLFFGPEFIGRMESGRNACLSRAAAWQAARRPECWRSAAMSRCCMRRLRDLAAICFRAARQPLKRTTSSW